jgi:hypothetical protein
MTDRTQKRAHPSENIKEQLKILRLVLAGAVVFSLLMGVLANIIFNYVVLDIWTCNSFRLLILSVILTALIIIYLLYEYAFKPYSQINKDLEVVIIYDRKGGEVIDDPFGGYYPQVMAYQAFKNYKNKNPDKAKRRIDEDILPSSDATKNHILTELLEYTMVRWLQRELKRYGENMPKNYKTITELSADLKKNTFISLFGKFRELEPQYPVCWILSPKLDLPEDIAIKYWSPAPMKGIPFDQDTFRIDFVGKYLEVCLTVHLRSVSYVRNMTRSPAPVFGGMYISQCQQDKIVGKLDKLDVVTFDINIEAKSKWRFGFPNLSYLNWADDWINRFVEGSTGGFDFNDFRKYNINSPNMLYNIYETVKETNMLAKDHGKYSETKEVTSK